MFAQARLVTRSLNPFLAAVIGSFTTMRFTIESGYAPTDVLKQCGLQTAFGVTLRHNIPIQSLWMLFKLLQQLVDVLPKRIQHEFALCALKHASRRRDG
jgi:hypothetical protein